MVDPCPGYVEFLTGLLVKATGNDQVPGTPKSAFTDFYRARHMEVLLFAQHYAAPYLDIEDLVAEAFASFADPARR